MNASAMFESRVATTQCKNIGRLTKVTVVSDDDPKTAVYGAVDIAEVYLPLSLGTVSSSLMIASR